MKVRYYPRRTGLSGKMGDLVYCYDRSRGALFAREYVEPRRMPQNANIASVSRQMALLNPSEDFRRDAKEYLRAYNSGKTGYERPLRCWNNVLVKLMYTMSARDGSIDLKTLTREEIYARDLPCVSVKRAVEEGLLPAVKGWEGMDGNI